MERSGPPTNESDNDPSSPADTSLLTVLANLDAEGYTGQMRAIEGGQVECLTCHRSFDADRIRADLAVRLEGASDPADMLIVLPVVCPHCQIAGTLLANYGPESQLDEVEVLRRLEWSERSGRS